MVLKKLGKISLLLMLPALILTGCSSNKDTVVRMRGYAISSQEFLNELNLSRTVNALYSNDELSKDVSDESLRKMASDTIKHLTLLEAFAQEGEKLKLNPTDEELEELFKTTKEQTLSIEGMQEVYDSVNYTDEVLKENLYKTETAYAYYLYLYDSISISGAQAREFFEKNLENLYTYESADAAHILIQTALVNEDGSLTELSAKEQEKAKKKAEEVLKKVEAGEDFNKLAKEYSDDEGTKEDGGELGSFGKGQMVEEFEAAAFSLKEGETSKLVKTKYGYHIIKLNKKTKTSYNYDDIETYVKQDLLDSLFLEKVKEIEKKYSIKTDNDVVNELLNNLEPISLPQTNSKEESKSEDTKKEESKKEELKEIEVKDK